MNNYISLISLISSLNTSLNDVLKVKLRDIGNTELIPSYGALLWIVYKNNNKVQIKQVYESLKIQKSTITEIIKRLVKLEYLTKEVSENDKRVSYIIATEKALEFKKAYDEITEETLEKMLHSFSEIEKDLFLKLIYKANENFQ